MNSVLGEHQDDGLGQRDHDLTMYDLDPHHAFTYQFGDSIGRDSVGMAIITYQLTPTRPAFSLPSLPLALR